jgi:hypothetical protein
MTQSEERAEVEALDFTQLLSRLTGMIGRQVIVAVMASGEAQPHLAGARPLTAIGRLDSAIGEQAEISKEREAGHDLVIFSLDNGPMITIDEARITSARFERLPEFGNESLMVELGEMLLSIENIDAQREHKRREGEAS